MEELIGEALGPQSRYQIQALLGKQAGRRTFLAYDTQTNQSVVVKVVLFSPDFTWQDLKLFEREAETLQALNHPAIPKYLDSFEVEILGGKGFALVQTYIDARSLQDWADSGRTFSEADLQAIAHALLKILHYLHHRNPAVIHRDLKPSNILLQDTESPSTEKPSFTLFLVDFGSVQTAKTSGTMTVVGTYGYMPPEQFGGRALPASDLYSLGATLIYLATGQHPAELTQDTMQIEFETEAHLSAAFTRWIRRLTYPDMARRIRTVDTAQQTLHRLQKEQRSRPAARLKPVFPSYPPAHYSPANYRPSTDTNYTVVLLPKLADIKVSTVNGSLQIQCLASRITLSSSQEEQDQPQKTSTPLPLVLIASMAFFGILGFAVLINASALVYMMLCVLVAFGIYYPLLSSTKGGEEKIISLSAPVTSSVSATDLSNAKLSLSNVEDPAQIRRRQQLGDRANQRALPSWEDSLSDVANLSDMTVRSLTLTEAPHDNRLNITLSAPDSDTPQHLSISGTRREIHWLRDHIHQWRRAPIN